MDQQVKQFEALSKCTKQLIAENDKMREEKISRLKHNSSKLLPPDGTFHQNMYPGHISSQGTTEEG